MFTCLIKGVKDVLVCVCVCEVLCKANKLTITKANKLLIASSCLLALVFTQQAIN